MSAIDCPRIEDFELLEKLGSGTFATVFKCIKKTARSDFLSIKCVDKTKLSASAIDNIITEIRLLKRLKHKHIVDMKDFLWDDRHIYIVMELCNAGNLSTYIKRHQSLPEPTCRFFLQHLSLAIQYMRANNVSHLDLKPHNLLLTRSPNMTLKVADFGFAQLLRSDEQNSSIRGSPLYMAPEVILRQCYTAKADLWSIGVILYECLFGYAPYQSRNMQELMEKIINRQRIELPRSAKISTECMDLLTRLLQHDAQKRIDFPEYFGHEFLNLEHAPSSENLEKAIGIVTRAVSEDNAGHFEEAYHSYCDSLQYFVPYINAEVDASKRSALRKQIKTYLHRAEEIKMGMLTQRTTKATDALIRECHCENQREQLAETPAVTDVFQLALTPSPLYQQLYPLTRSSPTICSALEIGRKAELYIFERNFTAALDTFRVALGTLVPALSQEPKGTRREMMHQLTQFWMQEAESLKSILDAQTWEATEDQPAQANHYNVHCSLQ